MIYNRLYKTVLTLIVISNMNLHAMGLTPTSSAEGMSLQAQEWTQKFIDLPDRDNYIGAYLVGYGYRLQVLLRETNISQPIWGPCVSETSLYR